MPLRVSDMLNMPPGTGTAITNAASATTPPLGMTPSTAAPGIGGGLAMPVDTNQSILQQANAQRTRTNQMFGTDFPSIQPGTPGAVAQLRQTNTANAARSLWQPGGGGRNR